MKSAVASVAMPLKPAVQIVRCQAMAVHQVRFLFHYFAHGFPLTKPITSRITLLLRVSLGRVQSCVPHALLDEVAGIAAIRTTALPHVPSRMEISRRNSERDGSLDLPQQFVWRQF